MKRMPAVLLLPMALSAAAAPPPWPADGVVRFRMEITAAPSEPCAGVLAVVPNGGILPPNGGCLVQTEDGAVLKHECVWANPREGTAIVFEEPKAKGPVWVTFSATGVLNVPRGPSAFCAGVFLYTEFKDGQLGEAKLIARDAPPGREARFMPIDNIGLRDNPLGPDHRNLSYISGWLKPPQPGPYHVATISDDGSEVHLDGKLLVAWPGVHRRDAGRHGEFGKEVELKGPRHRVEYFHFQQGDLQEANLVWRGGGLQGPGNLPTTVEPKHFTQSGRTKLTEVEGKDGRPVAVVDAALLKYLWFGDQPVNLYQFNAVRATGADPKTRYEWTFPGGEKLEGPTVVWPQEGGAPFEVALTVSHGARASVARTPVILERTPGAASVESAADRALFRDALLARCRGVAPPRRPCQGWGRDLWAVCVNLFEPYEGLDLLREIFTRSRPDLAAAVPDARRSLEDLFFLALRREDAKGALEWAERFQRDETDNRLRFAWALARADLLLYDLDNPAGARALLATLQEPANAAGGEAAVRLLVRQGDIDRVSGKADAARAWYTQAVERWQRTRSSLPPVSAARPRGQVQPAGHAADWRTDAVQAATYYKQIQGLIARNHIFEALALLEEWEVRFPFTKLSGEFVRAEADVAVHVGDLKRAVRVLRAYRESVDITNFLPDAMGLELDCLIRLKRTEEARRLAEEMVKRFPTHPGAQAARKVLGR